MSWLGRLYDSTIGKKAIMAVTGVILFAFIIGHLAGNLQILIPDGGARIDAYGRFLHESPVLLWGSRLVLLASVFLHILTSVQLALRNRRARPQPYEFREWREASYASRTMMISGPLIALFVVYHLGHFTTGHFHGSFEPLKVHDNMISGLQVWWASAAYVAAMILLGTHVYHGGWSLFQSLGISHPRYTPLLKKGAAVVAVLITLGYVLIPATIWMGLVR
ncbi:MAG: succinate dehydrogenase cytochrome b subunit [Planctomycetes bacterium]|nr:succinate dehydrogenase cytochrome b subunit [Planctomycetota bacterium]